MAGKRLLGLVAALVLATSAPQARSDPREMTVAEARTAGIRAIGAGDPATAEAVARALIAADPSDPFAHFLLARALHDQGLMPGARLAGRLSFRLARSDQQRFQSAHLVAQAAGAEGRFSTAQWWLRVAAGHAPAPGQRESVLRELQVARGMNRLSFGGTVHVTPTDNVNNGSSAGHNIIDGVPLVGVLSPEAQALSGVIVDLDGWLRWRIGGDRDQATQLGLRGTLRRAVLSSDARDAAPAADPRDYGDDRVELSLRHVRTIGEGTWQAAGTIAGGLQRSGSNDSFGIARATFEVAGQVSASTTLAGVATLEFRDRGEGEHVGSLQFGITRTLAGGHVLTGRVFFLETDTQRAWNTSNGHGVQIGFAPAQQAIPAKLDVGLLYAETAYPDYSVGFLQVSGGRSDRTARLSLGLTFSNASVAGLAPRISVSRTLTQSNVSRFETRKTDLGIGLEAQF